MSDGQPGPWRPHNHDTVPDQYPFTMRIIEVAERVDNATRMYRRGLLTPSQLFVDVFRFQQDITGLFGEVVREYLMKALMDAEERKP